MIRPTADHGTPGLRSVKRLICLLRCSRSSDVERRTFASEKICHGRSRQRLKNRDHPEGADNSSRGDLRTWVTREFARPENVRVTETAPRERNRRIAHGAPVGVREDYVWWVTSTWPPPSSPRKNGSRRRDWRSGMPVSLGGAARQLQQTGGGRVIDDRRTREVQVFEVDRISGTEILQLRTSVCREPYVVAEIRGRVDAQLAGADEAHFVADALIDPNIQHGRIVEHEDADTGWIDRPDESDGRLRRGSRFHW